LPNPKHNCQKKIIWYVKICFFYLTKRDSLEEAISDIKKINGDNKANIIITGSLYLASDFHKLL
ncbi:MAG: hypothetical protein AB8U36_06020, partial [Rickettsia aeschlimannii]